MESLGQRKPIFALADLQVVHIAQSCIGNRKITNAYIPIPSAWLGETNVDYTFVRYPIRADF
jgi:hypothetical protein